MPDLIETVGEKQNARRLCRPGPDSINEFKTILLTANMSKNTKALLTSQKIGCEGKAENDKKTLESKVVAKSFHTHLV